MSQNHNFSSDNELSLSSFNGDIDKNNFVSATDNKQLLTTSLSNASSSNNDDWKSADDNSDNNFNEIQDDLSVLTEEQTIKDGWANFHSFENNTNANLESTTVTSSSELEGDWANFKVDSIQPIRIVQELSNNTEINHDDDVFGDYSEVNTTENCPMSCPTNNSLNTESMESLISICFPLQSSTLSRDIDTSTCFELPGFTTYKDRTKRLPCFEQSLSLWSVLSNIANDPLGIQYQWRKSTTERVYHQALGVQERLRTNKNSVTPETSHSNNSTMSSTVHNENRTSTQMISPNFDWKRSDLENPLTVFDVHKTLDLDYYISPTQNPTSNKEEYLTSSTVVHRNNSAILSQNSTPIKTVDLYPGSTIVANDDTKPAIDSVPNYSFMNPKALLIQTQINN